MDQREEAETLLEDEGPITSPRRSLQSNTFKSSVTSLSPHSFTIFCIFALALGASFTMRLLEIPQVRALERAICNDHYRHSSPEISVSQTSDDIDEARCKLEAIQSSLAYLTGWKLAFDSTPGTASLRYFEPKLTRIKVCSQRSTLALFRTGWGGN